jgi:hypothetical protein
MKSNKNKNIEEPLLIYYNDETINQNLLNQHKSTLTTNSQAIYRISPTIVKKTKNNFAYPKIKINENDNLNYSTSTTDEENKLNLKFERTEDKIIDDNLKLENYLSNTDKDMIIGEIEIKKPDEDTDTRKYLDRYNLLRSFLFSMDPYNNISHLEGDENDEATLTFETLKDRLSNLFDIN